MTSNNKIVKVAIRIDAPASDVLSAFTDADKMSQFWFHRGDDGMKQGDPATFILGAGEDAFSFDVAVIELDFPNKLVIEWQGPDGHNTQVTWTCAEAEGSTILTIEESGFIGNDENITERIIDSTGGFSQVIVAAKALIEHGVSVNVVAAHP